MPPRPRRRSHWLFVLACLAVVSLGTAAAVHGEPAAAKAGGAAGAKAAGGSGASRADAHKVDFGLAFGDSLTVESSAEISASLNDAVNLGAKWIRIDLPWDAVQTDNANGYDWGQFDKIVSAADARKLHIDAVIDAPPSWARQQSCKSQESCPPADFATFADFAAAASRRYAPQGVHTWEIWNEPNLYFWSPKPDPAAYTELLKKTSVALRAADPKAFIILGGLAAVSSDTKTGYYSAVDFLSAVAKLGATKYVNAVGYHPYSLPTLPSVAANFQTVSSARDNLVAVLQKNGTPNVSVWLTETGAPTHPDKTGLTPAQVDSPAAEAAQAEYATDLVSTVASNGHVGADFWYSDVDSPSAGLYFGLRDAKGTIRPAFNAFKNAIAGCDCSDRN